MRQKLNIVKGISKKELPTLDTAPGEGAFALDHDGKALYMDNTAEEICGWSFSELKDKNFFKTVQLKMDTISKIGSSKCAALHSVSCSHLQMGATITHKNRRVIPISFISIPVFDEGRMYGKLFVFSENSYCSVAHEDYSAIVESAGSFILRLDSQGQVAYANALAHESFGDKLEYAVPTNIRMALKENRESLNNVQQVTNRVKTKQGLLRTIAWTISPVRDNTKKIASVSCIGNDISEQDKSNKHIQPDQILARKVFEQISEGVITFDPRGVVEYLNPMAEDMTGWESSDAKDLLLSDVFHVIDEKNRKPLTNFILRRARDIDLDTDIPNAILIRQDGREFKIQESISAIRDYHGVIVGGAIVFKNTEEVASAQRNADTESMYDLLTGVLARNKFEKQVSRAIASAKNERDQHALCYLNVNDFPKISGTYGSKVADEVLKHVLAVLNGSVRDTDVLGRLGDSDFGILLSQCPLDDARDAAKLVCQNIAESRFNWNGHYIDLSISVGLVPITASGGGLSDVMRVADVACFVAKNKGRNRVHDYRARDISVQNRSEELAWVHKIRRALEQNNFRLYCQSIVPLQEVDHPVAHHEILLRLMEEDGNIVRPGSFITAAEHYNMMPSIDRWVVGNTLELLQERMGRNDHLGVFSINLSAQSLDDESFLSYVIDTLDKTSIPAENICFEITESTAISNFMSATRFMSILKGMGCRFSLDDFGRGFSSYAYLKNLQIDYLKIDGSFVRDVANDDVDHAMVDSINQIGHIMGVQTIAEFVENEETLEHLIHLGVDHVQGYQLGKPRPMWHSVQNIKKVQIV